MKPIIKIKNLNKFYGNKHILKNINLDIYPNDKIGIVGPNGNGKTTLCEIIAKLRPTTSGEIISDDHLVYGMQLQENPFPSKMTAWDFCKFYIHAYKMVIPEKVLLEKIKLLTLEGIMNVPVNKLSGGQKQRVNILLATIHQPDILLLDELASGLDIESRDLIYKYMDLNLQKINTMILISHNLETIERICNRLLVLINGEIVNYAKNSDIKKEYGSITAYVRKHFKNYYEEKDKFFNTSADKNVIKTKLWLNELEKSNNKHSLINKETKNNVI